MNRQVHRLAGIEPDNLLAFLSLLGVLRSLETSRPEWKVKVSWTVDAPPVCPCLHVAEAVMEEDIATGALEGLTALVNAHRFPERNLKIDPEVARCELTEAADAGGYRADLWAALVSDKAKRATREEVESTPLCLMFGQGHQFFLDRLASVPRASLPKSRRRGGGASESSESHGLLEALFSPWRRQDSTESFRWDPVEDVRYAYRAGDPSKTRNKQLTQHGANRLAAVGLSVLTVFPVRRGREIRLSARGGRSRRGFTLTWPVWRHPMSLAAVRSLLDHPGLQEPEARKSLGVVEMRTTTRISVGKFMNYTRAIVPKDAGARSSPRRGRRREERRGRVASQRFRQ